MAIVHFPYGRTELTADLPDEDLAAVLTAQLPACGDSEGALVRRALDNPIGAPRLCELARGKKKVVVLLSDHTRPVPSRAILPPMLEEIRRGNPAAEITLLVATGCHRATAPEELREKLGPELYAREKVVVHDCDEEANLVCLGTLPSGGALVIHRLAAEADLLVAEGFIEPHFFAGFSGGRKSILPGICNAATVNENHSYKAVSNPHAAAGVLEGNPIHEDMLCAAKAVHVQFILNVALDAQKKIIAAWAGDLEKAHAEGVKFVRSLAQCPVVEGDIVVTSNGGYPLDQNLYQSPKAVATAEACCREGGVIIMCCSCADGMGGSNFERLITMGTVDEIDAYLSKIPPKESISEQWCAQIYSRILKHHKVILVTTFLDHELVRKANMTPASDVNEALEMALEMMGKNAQVVVIPDGVAVLAVKG